METKEINLIQLADAPDIPGLVFRGFQGEADFPAMLDIFIKAMEVDGEEAADTLEDLTRNYSHLVRCDPYTDMILAEVNGEPIAYGRCWWGAELNGDHVYPFFLNMKGEWRSKGIGKAAVKFLMDRILEIAKDHPADAAKYYEGWANQKQVWARDLVEHFGMDPARYMFEMVRPASEPVEVAPLPEGIEVRLVKPEEYRKVQKASAEAFRDHWGYVEPTEESYKNWIESPYFHPDLWKVAWDGDEVVGMVLNYIHAKENEKYNRKRGYTEDISVRRPWRRKGVARALLTQSIKMFQEMGMEDTCLGVDTENPQGALQLYTSVGYREVKRHVTYRKKFTV